MLDSHETKVLPRLKPIFVWQGNEDFHQHFWINKLISKFKAMLLVWAHHSSNLTLWIAYKLCQIFRRTDTHTCTYITFWSKFFVLRTHMINMQLHSVICTYIFRVHETIEILWLIHINQWFPWVPICHMTAKELVYYVTISVFPCTHLMWFISVPTYVHVSLVIGFWKKRKQM